MTVKKKCAKIIQVKFERRNSLVTRLHIKGDREVPNIKSAKKRVLVTAKKTEINKAERSALKTQMKKFDKAVADGDKEAANSVYPETVSAIDHAASKNIIHKNNAANKKAKLAKKLAQVNA